MKLELTIDESSTKKSLQDQAVAAFDQFKIDLAKAKLNANLEKVFRIFIAGEQVNVSCSQLFMDAASANPLYSQINLVLDAALPADKLAFKLELKDLESCVIVIK